MAFSVVKDAEQRPSPYLHARGRRRNYLGGDSEQNSDAGSASPRVECRVCWCGQSSNAGFGGRNIKWRRVAVMKREARSMSVLAEIRRLHRRRDIIEAHVCNIKHGAQITFCHSKKKRRSIHRNDAPYSEYKSISAEIIAHRGGTFREETVKRHRVSRYQSTMKKCTSRPARECHISMERIRAPPNPIKAKIAHSRTR